MSVKIEWRRRHLHPDRLAPSFPDTLTLPRFLKQFLNTSLLKVLIKTAHTVPSPPLPFSPNQLTAVETAPKAVASLPLPRTCVEVPLVDTVCELAAEGGWLAACVTSSPVTLAALLTNCTPVCGRGRRGTGEGEGQHGNI